MNPRHVGLNGPTAVYTREHGLVDPSVAAARSDADEALRARLPARLTGDRMRVVYVAGPYTGADGWVVACNVHRAEALGREVARLGAAPLIPHSIGARMSGTESYEYWCAATLEMMRRCDAVVFTPDWHDSKGARGEHAEAVKIGLPIFYDLGGLAGWLGSGVRAPYQGPPTPPLDKDLAYFLRDLAENYDHDTDAHRYGTRCRQCEAEKLRARLCPPVKP